MLRRFADKFDHLKRLQRAGIEQKLAIAVPKGDLLRHQHFFESKSVINVMSERR